MHQKNFLLLCCGLLCASCTTIPPAEQPTNNQSGVCNPTDISVTFLSEPSSSWKTRLEASAAKANQVLASGRFI
ncbi:hypothetical protein, partial [Acinetobacter haemolyticus]|uniref:hypothetical protein n=1 Tax=Acinetobacter haemolyticus TaxID=29430 RepID=UPI001BB1F54A